ncbi:MAG TPA: SDR family oxidoreductase [Bryobacteraceae bacterium]
MIKDSAVLVVGASSGIGRAIATAFVREGACVMVAARRQSLLADLQRTLEMQGHRLEYCVADAAHPDDMQRLADRMLRQFGKIDILVYATGTNTPDRSMERLTPQIWNEMIDINLNGAYYITHSVLPLMRQAGSGHLMYISSIGAVLPDSSGAAYQAAKRGLLGLAHATRLEEGKSGIRTCVICPGLVATDLVHKRPIRPTPEMLLNALQPEDVADIVLAIARLPPRVVVPELQVLPAMN